MAASSPFVEHCIELLRPLGSVRVRRMFGGHGFYVDDLFIALIAYDKLFLKADEHSRERFADAGCEPFQYDAGDSKHVTLGYWTAPPDAMDTPALMEPWARLALQAALAAHAAKLPKKTVKPRAPAAKAGAARKAAAKKPAKKKRARG